MDDAVLLVGNISRAFWFFLVSEHGLVTNYLKVAKETELLNQVPLDNTRVIYTLRSQVDAKVLETAPIERLYRLSVIYSNDFVTPAKAVKKVLSRWRPSIIEFRGPVTVEHQSDSFHLLVD